ncbi:hypothetical protein ACHHV8_08525 [Paenibacillus sp. TAB 01]
MRRGRRPANKRGDGRHIEGAGGMQPVRQDISRLPRNRNRG